MQEHNGIIVATFYKLVELKSLLDLKHNILEFCKSKNIKGTIILAEEGVNATVSGAKEDMHSFYEYMHGYDEFSDLEFKESCAPAKPFERMKVRIKPEVVGMAVKDLSLCDRGELVEPEKWDDLISGDDVLLIDVRNIYEHEFGGFDKAVKPSTTCFKEFPKWFDDWSANLSKDQKIAMYCTGGIRCEKSVAYARCKDFKNVYHLHGGVLEYFRKTANRNKKWLGTCFVFDDRVAVDDRLDPLQDVTCNSCGTAVDSSSLKNVTRGRAFCGDCVTA